jgi:hypothetical protein
MKLYTCPACGAPLAFNNLTCSCGTNVSFDAATDRFVSDGVWCGNRSTIACNWTAASDGPLCHACAMTEVIPDTANDENIALWRDAEQAKRWVLATVGRWGWFTPTDPGTMPVFHLMSEETRAGDVDVTMGHAEGLVTINVTEADPAERVARRVELGERYRTMIGHYRHELAHFLFERLKERQGFYEEFHSLFGDETADYAEALERHYGNGPPPNWNQQYISPYASSHPHEDWAECVANILHLTDITDSFVAAGLNSPSLSGHEYDAYAEGDAGKLITVAVELGIALNHVNRSMGISDIYPFVLTPMVREKLAMTHRWLSASPQEAQQAA